MNLRAVPGGAEESHARRRRQRLSSQIAPVGTFGRRTREGVLRFLVYSANAAAEPRRERGYRFTVRGVREAAFS